LRYAGKVTEWNDERGFGFVAPNGGGDRAFVHISELKARSRRPITGDQVTYSLTTDSRGRPQAKAVGFVEVKRATRSRHSSLSRSTAGIVALVAIAVASVAGLLLPVIAGAYFLFSFLSFCAYMKDKRAAKRNAWRTQESTLHLLDFLGGWPGGLIAQGKFHHKTIKWPFQFVFWLSVIFNIGGVWWLTVSGFAERLLASVVG
jgi:uncharacterized membrane protein YsdA (DUF1294 family)/cold shock CspA family protein